jgi:DNA-binding NtrC family response regulator
MSERGNEPVILVVEDDPAHSGAMARVLASEASYRLRFAASLAEAQREIAREFPALVLADLNLADGKAFELSSGTSDQPVLPVWS